MVKVVIGMSGGIDSTIAAYLLSKRFNVIGIHLCTWDSRDENGQCNLKRDWEDVQESCSILGIPCKSINYTKEYWTMVFTPFLKQLSLSGSPNPDIYCNSKIKFGTFYDYCMQKENADYVATGHYARISNMKLLKGIDSTKDQSYYLSNLKYDQLGKIMFPLGNLTKQKVREIARSIGLDKLIQKRESMGICFIGKRNFHDFIQEYIPTSPGYFVNQNGENLGLHDGIELYTIGQKARLGGSKTRLYVADKDPKTSRILLVPQFHPLLFCKSSIFEPFWIHGPPDQSLNLTIKHRYRMSPTPALINLNPTNTVIIFKEPQDSVAPGQHVTVYNGDQVLGGGPISTDYPRFTNW